MGSSYIHNMAQKAIGTLDVVVLARMPSSDLPVFLWATHGQRVKAWLRTQNVRPETLGRIADQGLASHPADASRSSHTTLYEVHRGPCVDPHTSGNEQLLQIAATAIIAAMSDLLKPRLNKLQVPSYLKSGPDTPTCEECGAIMVRNGSCYKCLNCGSTSGCS